jgi:uncharacterized protein YktB (UPF0637 family)
VLILTENSFAGFDSADFEVFTIPGFAERMEALKSCVRPKFEALGALLRPELSAIVGDEMFVHVAKHMRRRVNPPDDSWVAFGGKRGYKMGPHFQVCLWSTHALVQWGLIYEASDKDTFARNLLDNTDIVMSAIPGDYQWSKDHMKPEGIRQEDMTDADFREFANRLITRKNGEVMVGKVISKDEAAHMSGEDFHEVAVDTFSRLAQLHRMASPLWKPHQSVGR